MFSSLIRRNLPKLRAVPFIRRAAKHPLLADLARKLMGRISQSEYETWLRDRLRIRSQAYPFKHEVGLISFVTTVWNTPLPYLRTLAQSIFAQDGARQLEWVVLDNGSTDSKTRHYLETVVQKHPAVRYSRVEKNLGIIGGMRHVAERAAGRYLVPVDADDYLYPDCVRILISCIQQAEYPALLYSDEDHLEGEHPCDPYFKPDWDPVLFLNSCYIAHLCAIDRKLALELGAYSDPQMEGCHDWDTFLRFYLAGHEPLHVPEVLYSWRRHSQSTSGAMSSKPYIAESQRACLEKFRRSLPHADRFSLESSPLFNGTPDWWLRRRPVAPKPMTALILDGDDESCRRIRESCDYPALRTIAIPSSTSFGRVLEIIEDHQQEMVAFVAANSQTANRDWPWEALGLFEIHPDAAVVGGRLLDARNLIMDAGQYLGFGAGCDAPDRYRSVNDPGYSAQLWKQKSVSAVPAAFCVYDAEFLKGVLRSDCSSASLDYLNAWAGGHAARSERRIIYTPLLTAVVEKGLEWSVSDKERQDFGRAYSDVIPDVRNYPRVCGLEPATNFRPVSDQCRRNSLAPLIGESPHKAFRPYSHFSRLRDRKPSTVAAASP